MKFTDKGYVAVRAFSQADMSSTRSYGGTGLGLAISKIKLEAATGPVVCRDQQSDAVPSGLGLPQKLRILLAKDNPINQKVALMMLKKAGYSADVASNGLQVLQALDADEGAHQCTQRHDIPGPHSPGRVGRKGLSSLRVSLFRSGM